MSKPFKQAFPGEKDPVTYDNVAKAIAAFERTLLTPSRFDQFLRGKSDALSPEEKQGLSLVMEKGCIACHNGVGAGGGMYQKFGLQGRYEYSDDKGRYNVTKKEEDMYFFKVPMWRNVTRTAPYFHDGSVWDLKEAIRIMGRLQLGTELSDKEVDLIAAFMHSLEVLLPDPLLKRRTCLHRPCQRQSPCSNEMQCRGANLEGIWPSLMPNRHYGIWRDRRTREARTVRRAALGARCQFALHSPL